MPPDYLDQSIKFAIMFNPFSFWTSIIVDSFVFNLQNQ